MMFIPRVPWSISESFDADLPEDDGEAADNPAPAADGLADEESGFWDHTIFPF